MEVSGQLHTTVAYPWGKKRYPMDKRLGGLQNCLNALSKRKKIPSPPLQGIEPL
jgi:hypothetical protein